MFDLAELLRILWQVDSQMFTGWKQYSGLLSSYTTAKLRRITHCLRSKLSAVKEEEQANSSQPEERKKVLVVFVGAGTSGRMAAFLAAKFNSQLRSTPNVMTPAAEQHLEFTYLAAGGDLSLIAAMEGAEDLGKQGIDDLHDLMDGYAEKGQPIATLVLVGITCGLSAPYVGTLLHHVRSLQQNAQLDAVAILLGFNHPSHVSHAHFHGLSTHLSMKDIVDAMLKEEEEEQFSSTTATATATSATTAATTVASSSFVLTPQIGPEAITGSTRLKGGTATKILLEVLFSAVVWRYYPEPEGQEAFFLGQLQDYARLLHQDIYGGGASLWCQETMKIARAAANAIAHGHCVHVMGEKSAGLLGVIDASECPPTFGAAFEQVRGFVREGWSCWQGRESRTIAARQSELPSHYAFAWEDWKAPSPGSVIVVLPPLSQAEEEDGDGNGDGDGETTENQPGWYAARHKTATVSFTLPRALMAVPSQQQELGHVLNPLWGPEMALKLALNAMSTHAFIRDGKIWRNRMIDVQISNSKLFHRAVGIIQHIVKVEKTKATQALLQAIYPEEAPPEGESDPATEAANVMLHVQAAAGADRRLVPIALLLAKGRNRREIGELLEQGLPLRTLLINEGNKQ